MHRTPTLLLAAALVLAGIAMTGPQTVRGDGGPAAPPVSASLALPDTTVLDASGASASPVLWVVLVVLGAIWLVMLTGGSLWKMRPLRPRSPGTRRVAGPALRTSPRFQRALGRLVLRSIRQARRGSDVAG